MACTLCLDSATEEEQLIDISGDEARRLHIASILHLHFGFYFQVTLESPTCVRSTNSLISSAHLVGAK